VTKYKSAEACQAADVHFVELKSTFIKEKQNLIIRKAGIEIEITGNSNTVIIREILAVKRAREFASKTESLKKLYESQTFLFDAEEMGLKLENQCPEICNRPF
jgi:hypothetical protein